MQPRAALSSDPLTTHLWANAQLGAGAGPALGQPGAAGSLVNQAPAFEASAGSWESLRSLIFLPQALLPLVWSL